jgi:predicted dehydrogenase
MVGSGLMADLIVPDFALVENTELRYLCTRNPEATKAKYATWGIEVPLVSDFEAMCADPEVDLVYIAVPHGLHYQYAVKALDAGKPILVEKAFTLTQAQAQDLADRAAAKGLFVMEAMWTRFLPLYRKLQEEIANGLIGEVKYTSAYFGIPFGGDENHRLIAKDMGGGSLLDQGVYTINFADIFFGGAQATSVEAKGTLLPNGVDGLTMVNLEYGDGRYAQANSSVTVGLGTEAFIAGTDGGIHVKGSFWNSDDATVIKASIRGISETKIVGGKIGAGYSHMIQQVSADVLAGKTQSDIHPISNTIRMQGYFDQILAQLGVKYDA